MYTLNFSELEHPLRDPPDPMFPNGYRNCPCCSDYCDDAFVIYDDDIIGCTSCLKKIDTDLFDSRTCPKCGEECDSFFYVGGDGIVGCCDCTERVDPADVLEYRYVMNCLNGRI